MTLSESVSRIISAYSAQGDHRTGTEVDKQSAEWLAAEIQAMGVSAELDSFEIDRLNVIKAELNTGDLRLAGVPLFDCGYTDAADRALKSSAKGFRIGLVHSPEAVAQAAAAGIDLYLTGHTHAGQICLPGGIPIMTNSTVGRSYASGLWRYGNMVGYTSSGIGVSGLPLRFNSQGEVTHITLRSA